MRAYLIPAARQQNIFMSLLLLASLIPFFLVPVLRGNVDAVPFFQVPLLLLWLVMHAHQSSTSFFFLDKAAYPVIKNNKPYFFYLPLAVFAFTASYFYFASEVALDIYMSLFAATTVYHFQKQNVGVYIMLSAKLQASNVSNYERGLIFWSFLVGAINAAELLTDIFSKYHDQLLVASVFVQIVLLLGYGHFLYITWLRVGSVGMKARAGIYVILLFMILFYAPIFLFPKETSYMMYAGSHALQYWLLMILVSINYGYALSRRRKADYIKYAIVIATVAMLVMTATFVDYSWLRFEAIHEISGYNGTLKLEKYLMAVGTSFSLTHYIIDARIWKLSLPDSRAYILQRIGYGLRRSEL